MFFAPSFSTQQTDEETLARPDGGIERSGRRSGPELGPGERLVGGRVLYSSAWLSSPASQPVRALRLVPPPPER